jgi:hypothetical protein
MAALGLSGCQGIASSLLPPSTATASILTPAPMTTTPRTATPSVSTTRPPAPVPSAARAKTKAGSAAFVSFFWQQFNRSQTEPNPDVLAPLFQDSCAPCAAYVEAADALQSNHQRYGDPPFVVKSVKADTLKGNTATVLSTIDQQPAGVVDQDGGTVATAAPRQAQFLVTLTWTNGWKVSDIQNAI